MRTRKLFALTLFFMSFACLAPVLAHSATYYVAKTGSNNHTCTQAQSASTPKLTIAAGLACMSSGSTLVIGDGIYPEFIVSNQLVSGASDSLRTIIKAQNQSGVTIRPNSCAGAELGVVVIAGKSFITFDGITFDAVNCKSGEQAVFYITSAIGVASSFLNFVNTEMKNSRDTCITAGGSDALPHNFKLINNKIHDCAQAHLSTTEHGIYLRGGNHLIERNEVYDIWGYGIHQHTQSSSVNHNNIIRYNTVYNSTQSGILMGSGDNNIAHHNIVSNNGEDGIRIISGTPDNNQVYNNSFYNNGGACIRVGSSTAYAHNTKIKNNLCLSNAVNGVLISSGSRDTVQASNLFSTAATLVVDAANHQFSPRDNSALINAGENISGFSNGKFLGSAPDQGALEFEPRTSSPPPPSIVPNAPLNLQVMP